MNEESTLKKTREYYQKYYFNESVNSHENSYSIQNVQPKSGQIIMIPNANEIRSNTPDIYNQTITFKLSNKDQIQQKLGNRNVYSRENVQHMQQKLREKRISRYSSGFFPENLSKSEQLKLKGKNNVILTSKIQNTPSMIKSKSTLYQSRKDFRANSLPLKQKIPEFSFEKLNVKPRKHSKEKQENKKVITNQFRTKIKAKCVDQNPKYLATMIRKKIQFMGQEEVYQYIQNLVKRSAQKFS